MHSINPKEKCTLCVMPYAYGDYILTYGEITYQSFGLDRKKTVRKRSFKKCKILMISILTADSSFMICR